MCCKFTFWHYADVLHLIHSMSHGIGSRFCCTDVVRYSGYIWEPHRLSTGFQEISRVTLPDSKVHGANVGPIWVLSAPDGPHVGPTNLAIGVYMYGCVLFYCGYIISSRWIHLTSTHIHRGYFAGTWAIQRGNERYGDNRPLPNHNKTPLAPFTNMV